MVRRIVKNISISRHLLQFLESGWRGGGGGATRKVSGEVFGILSLSRKVRT